MYVRVVSRNVLVVMAAVLAAVVCCGAAVGPRQAAAAGERAQAFPSVVYNEGRGGVRYVALGDSGAAGPVLLPQREDQPSVCLRSQVNYPSLLARSLGARAFSDASCTGATLDNLYEPQDDAAPQLAALRRSTTLVTLNAGPNDVAIADLVAACSMLFAPTYPDCGPDDLEAFRAKVRALRPEVVRAVGAIRHRSPRALVVLATGAVFFPEGGCFPLQPYEAPQADIVQQAVNSIARMQRAVARSERAVFGDLPNIPGFEDHTTCAVGDNWIQGVEPPVGPDGAILFHPTAAGMRAIAGYLDDLIRERGRPGSG